MSHIFARSADASDVRLLSADVGGALWRLGHRPIITLNVNVTLFEKLSFVYNHLQLCNTLIRGVFYVDDKGSSIMRLIGNFDLERAKVIPRELCRRPVAYLGNSHGGQDSEGRAVVLGDAGSFVSGYLTDTDEYILLDHMPKRELESARVLAEDFTQSACVG
ncbi:MAG: hypothetical protein GXP05_14990 [Alphaproteobacteria bacterium]|nr:hypothetical protein [Alphaproteobacteria bacterium]